jgi:ADP-ribosylglycohydrolase
MCVSWTLCSEGEVLYLCVYPGPCVLNEKSCIYVCILDLVFQGGDADSNACVAGALLACKLGLEAIPSSWRDTLLHKDWLEQQVSR